MTIQQNKIGGYLQEKRKCTDLVLSQLDFREGGLRRREVVSRG